MLNDHRDTDETWQRDTKHTIVHVHATARPRTSLWLSHCTAGLWEESSVSYPAVDVVLLDGMLSLEAVKSQLKGLYSHPAIPRPKHQEERP